MLQHRCIVHMPCHSIPELAVSSTTSPLWGQACTQHLRRNTPSLHVDMSKSNPLILPDLPSPRPTAVFPALGMPPPVAAPPSHWSTS